MASDSATAVATQQSIKAYVDGAVGAGGSYTLLGTLDLATGAPSSVTLGSLDLSSYSRVWCVIDEAETSTAGNFAFESETVSSTGGVNQNYLSGIIIIDLASGVWFSETVNHSLVDGGGVKSEASTTQKTTLSTATTSLSFSISAGTFTGGEIKIYGVP